LPLRLRRRAAHERVVYAAGLGVERQVVIDTRWGPLADEQLRRRRQGKPLTHRLVRLEPSSRRAIRVLGPLDGLLVDG
jgi:hypothetical protein